jgi:hypothetical protein
MAPIGQGDSQPTVAAAYVQDSKALTVQILSNEPQLFPRFVTSHRIVVSGRIVFIVVHPVPQPDGIPRRCLAHESMAYCASKHTLQI